MLCILKVPFSAGYCCPRRISFAKNVGYGGLSSPLCVWHAIKTVLHHCYTELKMDLFFFVVVVCLFAESQHTKIHTLRHNNWLTLCTLLWLYTLWGKRYWICAVRLADWQVKGRQIWQSTYSTHSINIHEWGVIWYSYVKLDIKHSNYIIEWQHDCRLEIIFSDASCRCLILAISRIHLTQHL